MNLVALRWAVAQLGARPGETGKVDVLFHSGGAVAQLGARLDGIEEVVGSNPIGSTNFFFSFQSDSKNFKGLCFAKIPCELKITRFPAAMAVPPGYPFTPERQESVSGAPSGIPVCV
jgi:hypothetical protein